MAHDLTTHTTLTCSTNLDWSETVQGSGGKTYTVAYGPTPRGPYQYDWSCTCSGFKFRGKCKHVEAAKARRCGWNGTLELVEHVCSCPDCGGPVTPINVAV